MSLASTANPHARHFSRSPFIAHEAEAELFAWAHQHRAEELVGYAFEDIVAPAGADDGRDRHDPADARCLALASPSRSERDPNQLHHDRYLGTVFQ